MGRSYIRAADLPQVIPVFPLDGVLLLPRGQLPLNVFEPRYLNMVDDAMAGDRMIGMIQTQGGDPEHPGLVGVGCAGRITSFAETGDGRYMITLTGVARFSVLSELPVQTPYRQVQAGFEPFAGDLRGQDEGEGFDREDFFSALRPYLERRLLEIDWETAEDAPTEALINSLSMALPFGPAEKQLLLEQPVLLDRADCLTALMRIDAAEPDDDEPRSVQ